MTKFLNVIQATLKANYKKPAYWAQIIGSVLIIGLAVATVFFGRYRQHDQDQVEHVSFYGTNGRGSLGRSSS
ncbi:hypothetical protein [Lactiplantibacillus plantarum]|uniref:hypothetical protein n=1 Tax=Lactiplantibacillus plantarum TaxID=1590 RepID=UPI000B05E09D|nr:hypothetical protein [Lactiplantibacillus plantarum]